MRKPGALRRYLGKESFGKWMAQQAAAASVAPVAEKIVASLAEYAKDTSFKLNAEKDLMPSDCLGSAWICGC